MYNVLLYRQKEGTENKNKGVSEMTITKKASWTLKDGNEAIAEIKRTKEVVTEVAYADGDNVELGKKTFDSIEITVTVNGQVTIVSRNAPELVTEAFAGRHYAELKEMGAHARLGSNYVSEDAYNAIMAAITEIEAELIENEDYQEAKAQELAKEREAENNIAASEKIRQDRIAKGWCPKCETYCYGDCES